MAYLHWQQPDYSVGQYNIQLAAMTWKFHPTAKHVTADALSHFPLPV